MNEVSLLNNRHLIQMKYDELEEKSNVSFESKIDHDQYLHCNFSIDYRGIIDPKERDLHDEREREEKINLPVVVYREHDEEFL